MTRTGRPPAVAPPGRVTLTAAARRQGISRSRAHVLVTSGKVPARQEHDGTWTLAEADVALLVRQKPATRRGDHPVMLRPSLAVYAQWERAAGEQPVSAWLTELANRAVRLR